MDVQRVLITEPERFYAGFVERLGYDMCASGLLRGHVSVGVASSLSAAERRVRYALKHGFLSPRRTEEMRLLFAEGRNGSSVKLQTAIRGAALANCLQQN